MATDPPETRRPLEVGSPSPSPPPVSPRGSSSPHKEGSRLFVDPRRSFRLRGIRHVRCIRVPNRLRDAAVKHGQVPRQRGDEPPVPPRHPQVRPPELVRVVLVPLPQRHVVQRARDRELEVREVPLEQVPREASVARIARERLLPPRGLDRLAQTSRRRLRLPERGSEVVHRAQRRAVVLLEHPIVDRLVDRATPAALAVHRARVGADLVALQVELPRDHPQRVPARSGDDAPAHLPSRLDPPRLRPTAL